MSSLNHEEQFEKVFVDIMNPKSITYSQLYGDVDSGTGEWDNGIA
jgi:hypothetical protein